MQKKNRGIGFLNTKIQYNFVELYHLYISTEDHNSIPTSSSSQHTSHSSPLHHHHQHLNAIATTNYYQHSNIGSSSTHHLQQIDGGGGGVAVAGGSSSGSGSQTTNAIAVPPSTSSSQGFAEEFYTAADFSEVGQSEHYIYVTYPPELKRRLLERYGRDIYLMLLKKDNRYK